MGFGSDAQKFRVFRLGIKLRDLQRGLVVLVPFGWLLLVACYPGSEWEFVSHRSAFIGFSLVWALIAGVIALTNRCSLTTRNVESVRPRSLLILLSFILLLLGLVRFGVASGSWIPLFLLLVQISVATPRPQLSLAALLLGLLFPAISVEAVLYALRNFRPGWSGDALMTIGGALYDQDLNAIQYSRDCGKYDRELFYTLRSGHCVFANTEFSTTYKINSLGLRDDELSLDAPEVVALGDSHTMGWGVEQEQSYASRLERITGMRVLNAGVASYGTARELALLKRIDRRGLRYLLLQYSRNDVEENQEYLRFGGRLRARSAKAYEELVRTAEDSRRYYPGRYTTYIASTAFLRLFQSVGSVTVSAVSTDLDRNAQQDELRALLLVIETQPVDLSNVEIILFEINGNGARRTWFARELRELLSERAGRRHMSQVRVVDVMDQLDATNFFPLDGHPNASGHEKVARKLAQVFQIIKW